MRFVIVTTHPIQYQAPLFRLLAKTIDLTVVFMVSQTREGQAAAGFGTEFEWDVPLLAGYSHVFAETRGSISTNKARGIVLYNHEQLFDRLAPSAIAVFGWFPRAYLQVINWARRRKVPLVCRGESNLLSPRWPIKRVAKQLRLRRLFRTFSTFAPIGQRNRELYRACGVEEQKLHDAPYSVDTSFFEQEFRRHRPSVRQPGHWRIGFAGKLIEKKRPFDLVNAVARCRSKDRVEAIVIGDGPLRQELESLAAAQSVHLPVLGFLNQSEIVAKGYSQLDAVVLPSNEQETWGLVINEAMTGGIPAIVSNVVGCAPDLIAPDKTGYVFPVGDVPSLAGCIDALVKRLEAGHEFAPAVLSRIKDYSIDKTAEGMDRAFTAAIG